MPRNEPDQHEQFINSSTLLLNALSNATRLQLLQILCEGEISVGSLSELVGTSKSAVSQHLATLRYADLVSARRDAQTVYYCCNSLAVKKVLAILSEVYAPAETSLSYIA